MSTTVRAANLDRDLTALPNGPSPNKTHTSTISRPAIDTKKWLTWERFGEFCKHALARGKVLAWTIVTKIPLLLVYFVFISEGIRHLAPDMATKLHTLPIPFLVHLEDYESTHELDVAHVAAELLLVFSFVSWHFLLRWVLSDEFKDQFRQWKWNSQWVERILLTGAVVIVIGEHAGTEALGLVRAGAHVGVEIERAVRRRDVAESGGRQRR